MDYLTRIFNATEPQLVSAASTLVEHAAVTAVGAHDFLLKRFTMMSTISLDDWADVSVVAATFAAASQLDDLGETDELAERLLAILAENLDGDGNGDLAQYLDLVEFAQDQYDRLHALDEYKDNEHLILPDLIGLWLLRKLTGATLLAPEELHLARTAGLHIYNTYSSYWEGISQTS